MVNIFLMWQLFVFLFWDPGDALRFVRWSKREIARFRQTSSDIHGVETIARTENKRTNSQNYPCGFKLHFKSMKTLKLKKQIITKKQFPKSFKNSKSNFYYDMYF